LEWELIATAVEDVYYCTYL